MNRKILVSAIVASSFFLIFLGMRNPVLSGSGLPKSRPRAVIENTVKNIFEVVQQLQVEDVCPQEGFRAVPDQRVAQLEQIRASIRVGIVAVTNPSARASPSPLSPCSWPNISV